MIPGFDIETAPLTDEELALVPGMVAGLRSKVGASKAITAKDITAAYAKQRVKMTGARVRKMVNHIRRHGLVTKLIATSEGYYIAESDAELSRYLRSLTGRIAAIQHVHDTLKNQLTTPNQ